MPWGFPVRVTHPGQLFLRLSREKGPRSRPVNVIVEMPTHFEYDAPALVPPVDNGALMTAAAGYIFWPVHPPLMLLRAERHETWLRFHLVQAFAFGAVTSTAFLVFTLMLGFVFRRITPESLWFGAFLTGIFVAWLIALLFCFCLFLAFAWRAGRGDVFRVPVIGAAVEQWVLASADTD